MINVITPVYQSEVAPPRIRGRMVGTHGFSLVLGYVSLFALSPMTYCSKLLHKLRPSPLAELCSLDRPRLLLCEKPSTTVAPLPRPPRYVRGLEPWTMLRQLLSNLCRNINMDE